LRRTFFGEVLDRSARFFGFGIISARHPHATTWPPRVIDRLGAWAATPLIGMTLPSNSTTSP
jgi:hypothetical protein